MAMSEGLSALSLFPLPVVLFPGATLPLHIFEDRYKLMIGRVLEDEERLFGVVFWDGESSGVAETGCTAKIETVKKFEDGRMNLITVGLHRFRIVDVLEEQPYIVASIEYLNDTQTGDKAIYLVDNIKKTLVE